MRYFFRIIVLSLEAFVRYVYDLEDEIDKLAAVGTPAAKLRLERLSGRLGLERKRHI